MTDLIARIEAIRQRAAVDLPSMPQASPVPAPRPSVQLPLWPEPVRGVPNGFLRSALFGAIRRGRRRFLQREKIHSVDGVTILQTGPRLDQSDLDVWEQCLHLARTGLGLEVRFAGHGFLKAIGRGTGKSQHEWLKESLARLMSTVVEMQDGKRAYAGQLIHHWYRDDETHQHVIVINPKLAALYTSDGWTAEQWDQRLALRRQPLAQWLHGFYSTHAEPYPYSVRRLYELCGSEAKSMRHFREELRAALSALATATGWQCSIDDGDLVHVVKTGSPAQQRHKLRKRLGKARHSTGTGTA